MAEEHELNMHFGKVLLRLANTYGTLPLTIVEAVQNAVDANAKQVFVGIDVAGRQVVIFDDGIGVTEAKFREALLSVGDGIKTKEEMGRFGLGLISPLTKCEKFVFMSRPIDAAMVNSWTFVAENIRQQRQTPKIPFKPKQAFPATPKCFAAAAKGLEAEWRTRIHLHKVTEDKVLSFVDLDELEGHIRTKLGDGMLKKGTTVHVLLIDARGEASERSIDVTDFKGEPLKVVEYSDPDCGRVVFQLYKAPKIGPTRRGDVLLMQLGDNSRIHWRDFQTQAMGTGWLNDLKGAAEALRSGFFEGIIHIEKVTLDAERSKFMLSEALLASYVLIDRWFQDHGRQYFDEQREQRRDERYKSLGEQSLERILSAFETDPALATISRRLVDALPDYPVVRSERAPRKEAREAGAKKQRRTVAESPRRKREGERDTRDASNFSLRFAYEIMPESMRLFEFDASTGTITFNILNPTWIHLDETNGKHTPKNAKWIMHLQEWLAFKVLLLFSQYGDEGEFELNRAAIDAEVTPYTALFVSR